MVASQEEAIAPVLYELGKAIYISQQFEASLLLVLAFLNSKNGAINEESFLEGFNSHSQKTMGQLVRAFGSKLPLPERFLEFIKEGVDLRNSIAHGFVMRNTEKFRTASGRQALIDELKDAQYVLDKRRIFAEEALDRCLRVFGGSLVDLRMQALQEMDTDLAKQGVRR